MPKIGSMKGKIKKESNLELIKDLTALDQTPASQIARVTNPGGAIYLYLIDDFIIDNVL